MNAGRPLIPMIVVQNEDCGPAMAPLSPAQRAFVYAFVHFGCSRAEAARRAGYSRTKQHNAKVTAYGLWRREDVQAAILEESRKVLRSEGPKSIRTLAEIRDDKKNEAKDRLKAAVELMNRGGLNAVSEHHVSVEHRLTDAQKDRRILDLARELGLPDDAARKLLIAPDAIDAEFTEVPPEKTQDQIARAETYARTNEREKQAARRALSPEELAAHKQRTREERRATAKARYELAQGAAQFDPLAPIEPGEFGESNDEA